MSRVHIDLQLIELINRTTGHAPYHEFTISKQDIKKVFTKTKSLKKSILAQMVYVANY